ncbi:phytochelatin synthase family protein [Anabaena sp. WFMT]|uniref:phytochelatin synthase family protein n=1 Tax=Anabaena sp. WFMT TaxID=3449730 RepID=UPI003F244EB0
MKSKTYLKIYIQFLVIGLSFAADNVIAQTLPLASNLIGFDTPEGETLLISSKSRADFFPLSMQFVTQDNLAYCGVATIVMVLNSLKISAPETPEYQKFKVFTQDNFFSNQKTQQVISLEKVMRGGMTLQQLGGLLSSYDGVKITVYHGSNSSLQEFRKLAAENLKQPGNFVIVNYLRTEIGQERGGHISPLAAYNEVTDRFLIMDVSRYKYPPVWVKTAYLWKAMNTVDLASGKTRGFVFVSRE